MSSDVQIISTAKGKKELVGKLPVILITNYKTADVHFKVKRAQKFLANLDEKEASGLDGIPAVVLKNVHPHWRLFLLDFY